jgi:diadenosine tetraphosphate (Ap4A) HIT family hydrolase
MVENCLFCNDRFGDESIKRYDNWDLQLFRDDQYYIGRTVAVFKDRHIVDLSELRKSEREELFTQVIPDLQASLSKIYEPDLYNYSSIGNDCPHLHMHVIPRYKEPRSFNGKEFEDEYWNQTYSQSYERVKLDEENRKELIQTMRDCIPN